MRSIVILLIFGLSILGPTTHAQNDLTQLIDSLQGKYQRLTSLAADFTQTYSAPGQQSRRETGRLVLKKPGKMRWDYDSPEQKLYVSDGKTIFEYVPAERTATRTKVREANDLRAPFMFLLGRGDLRRDFRRIETVKEAPARAGNLILRLAPKRESGFRELLLEVEPRSLRIDRLTFVDDDGGRSDFIFSNIKENVAVSDAQFTFRPPAGVQVIDGP